MQRSIVQEAIAAPNVGGIVRLTGFILRTSLLIEMLGAMLLFSVFSGEFGFARGAWYAVFHSISAFCNAGFDLMGIKQPFSSLTDYADNPLVSVTIACLIVVGGIGFLTWERYPHEPLAFLQIPDAEQGYPYRYRRAHCAAGALLFLF